ncbi:hypothetical protein EDM53_05385 [Rickettsiales endosymbiont of Peranema trichophorum]|uniref:F0F1 ATP synthase subunit B family protein n=1 Tax=Rickettsiales endosymbiont of Peranema trichophorum TaxID=2486577 RepID=UPI001023C69C|nr:hypothetical protein [Rickettsiales endosymbiont of Peranema trichophorum]RZI45389.1 hypothetical protein EDM53_05385 [Rickettsiales endosymbiont of Peranema trichophorum]
MLNEGMLLLLSFVLLGVIVFGRLKYILFQFLGRKHQDVAQAFEEAAKVKMDALRLLEQIEIQYHQVQKDVKDIVHQAQQEANDIIQEAEDRAAKLLARRTELAMNNIMHQECQIINDIKTEAINSTLVKVSKMFAEELEYATKLELIDDGIKSLKKIVH